MEIIEKNGFAVIGIKVEARWDELHEKMPKAWQKMMQCLDEVSDRQDDVMMNVSLSETDGVYKQLVGVEVAMDAEVPEGMTKVLIPPKKYVWHQHKGGLSEIAESFGKMYDWAEQQNIETGTFKIDYGYRKDGSEKTHDLFIRVI